jgi:hypothetical protein
MNTIKKSLMALSLFTSPLSNAGGPCGFMERNPQVYHNRQDPAPSSRYAELCLQRLKNELREATEKRSEPALARAYDHLDDLKKAPGSTPQMVEEAKEACQKAESLVPKSAE